MMEELKRLNKLGELHDFQWSITVYLYYRFLCEP